ncbi:MAG: hypothetical protein GYA24_06425 [Candidatus Lokiarchaeota archaeon]|nr:hypothetical protein [Candidatus Lokiarchaeota archaeon]
MSNNETNPVEAFKKLLQDEAMVQATVRNVASKPALEYLMNPLPLSPMLQDAFKDPLKALKKFMTQHTSRVQEDLVEFEGLILPRNAVSLAVAAIFEYALMIQRNATQLKTLDQRFKNQCPIPVLWGSEGMGKTTFALAVARKIRGVKEDDPAGVAFANFAPFTEPGDIVGEINAPKMYARSQQLSFFLNLASQQHGQHGQGLVPDDVISAITRYDLSFENVALWDLTALITGAMAGIGVVGDEIGRMPPRALDGLMTANVATYSFGGHVVQATPGHFLICTANPKRPGDVHFTTDPAQQRRFVLVDFNYDIPLESVASKLEGQRSAELLKEVVAIAKERNITISPRQVLYFIKLAKYADETGDKKGFLHGLVNGLFTPGS